ncbi:MAG TPA: DNA polymerase III subunit delta [Candidatus Saccharimonadales bacterium]|nr:DNA polymerase III subunit delta [Candidatus Saccharimonadales bacterium]
MVTTLTGENDVLRQEALKRLVDSFVAEHTDMGLERLDGEDASFERMQEAAQSLPFLAPRKLVVLRAPGLNKEFAERFEQFVADVAETNDVVLVEPKLDKRLAYYKQLKKLTDFKEFPVLDGPALQRYLTEYAKQQSGVLSSGDARLLIDRVGTNQLVLQHEADKLLAYNPKIDRASIELLTERTPQSSIFELLDAAFAGNAQRALKLYAEQRAMRVEPQQILAMLVWQLHILAIVKTAGGKSSDGIAREARLSPFTVSKTQNLARRITLQQLKTLVRDLRAFDVRLKSEGLSADEVAQYYLLNLAAV